MPDAQVTFIGAGQSLEPHTVRAAGYNYAPIPCRSPSRHPLDVMRFVTDNVAGFWASRWFLKEQNVSLVVGLGGYHSGGNRPGGSDPPHSDGAVGAKRAAQPRDELALAIGTRGMRRI